jgi:lipoyl(octanoyl) transferase
VSERLKTCLAAFAGCVPYADALELQMRVCEAKKRGFVEDVLLLLEHPPTITLGRNGQWQHLLASEPALASRGVVKFEVDRGGDITFHGPGQLVGYPLMQLDGVERDVHRFMYNLEESLIRLLAGFGIAARRHGNLTGVWTDSGKIAAMGVHISRWITRHGFALNVNTDLSFFDLIVPCGIQGKGVASMHLLTPAPLPLSDIARVYAPEFGRIFLRHVVWNSVQEIREKLEQHARYPTIPS